MEEAKKDIVIRVGDKVITADGLIGKVIYVCTCDRCAERGFFEATYQVNGRTDTAEQITFYDFRNGFKDFYLIGKRFFGNKVNIEELKRRIEEQKIVVKRESEALDELRKQLWTLTELMVPDWKERAEARKKAAEERRAKNNAEQHEPEESL